MNAHQKNRQDKKTKPDEILGLIDKLGEAGEPLRFTYEAIKAHKDTTRCYRNCFKYGLVSSEITIVVASVAATAIVALSSLPEWSVNWAILPTSIVTVTAGIVAIFGFRGGYVRHWRLSSELAELESRLEFDLKLANAEGHDDIIDGQPVAEYTKKLFNKTVEILRINVDEVALSMIDNK